ncbi:MAG TPA: MFS transporter [Kofleriaceae bacterium]|nr:MFS transporter [Kofleriaceae bacterium]
MASTSTLTRAQLRLFVFLGVASFFEGYDFLALSQVLAKLREEMSLSEADAGWLVAFTNAGTVVAYLLVRKADRWGRRKLLNLTIFGYATFSFLTGLSWDAWSFAGFQFVARIFLIGEGVIAMVYAAEEFPAERRGMVIGVILAMASFGSIVCAGVVPLLVKVQLTSPITGDPLGWRLVYFVGVVPLLLLGYARRNLAETRRFAESGAAGRARQPLGAIWRTPYARRVVQLAVIWGLAYICNQNAVTFFKDYAIHELGLTEKEIGGMVAIAALIAMPMVFAVGPMMDRIGRKRGAAVVFLLGAAGVLGSFTLTDKWMINASMVLAIFGASAFLPVLTAFTTELFPTELRGDAFAWANNLLGRLTYVLSPIALGTIAETHGWGPTLAVTTVGPVLALILVFAWMPETTGKELEETAALGAGH